MFHRCRFHCEPERANMKQLEQWIKAAYLPKRQRSTRDEGKQRVAIFLQPVVLLGRQEVKITFFFFFLIDFDCLGSLSVCVLYSRPQSLCFYWKSITKKRGKRKTFTERSKHSAQARTPAPLTSCLPHFTAFFSICSHNLNKKIFLPLLIGHIFHTQHKHNDKNDPLIFSTVVAFSKLLQCQRTHQPTTTVARSRRHFHSSSISNNADKLIISVPELRRLSDKQDAND